MFQNCAQLTSVTLPAGLMTLGAYVFDGCSSLSALTYSGNADEGSALPSTVTVVGNYAFNGCSSLEEINLESIKTVGTYCFQNCVALRAAELTSATSIGNYAFNGCSELTTVKLPAVTTLGTNSFRDCVKLSNVQLNMSLKTISNSAFRGCKALELIQLPNELEKIDTYAFRESGLTLIEFPVSLTDVDFSAFGYCYNLEEITVKDTESGFYIDEESGWLMYRDGESLALLMTLGNLQGEVIVPEGVTAIGASAFEGRRSMTGVQLPSTLESIGRLAFWQTGITRIVIPAGVKEIGDQAFAYSSVQSAELNCKDAFIDASVFANCSSLISVSCWETRCSTIVLLSKRRFFPQA